MLVLEHIYVRGECVLNEMPPQWSQHNEISGGAGLPVKFTGRLFSLLGNLFLWQSSVNPFIDMWPFPLCLHINGTWKKSVFPPTCSFFGGLYLCGVSPAKWHLWYSQFRTSCCVGRAPLWPGKHYICPQGDCSLTRQKGRSGLLLLFARYLFLRMHIFPLSLPGPQIWVPFSHCPCSHLPISALMECTRILEYPFPIRIICFLIDRQQCIIDKRTI